MNKIKRIIKKIVPEKWFCIYKYNATVKNSKKTYAEAEREINKRFREVFGRDINWKKPTTYNEKINVSKLYGDTLLKTRLTDKISAVDWVKERLGKDCCEFIPLLATYDSMDEIDFSKLPEKYVMKMNNDSGSVFICDEKHPITKDVIMEYECLYQRRNFAYADFEMQYKDIEPKIMIEKYMGGAIRDYKFLCFNGKVYSCRVDFDRFDNHTRNFYDKDWRLLSFSKGNFENKEGIKKPKNFEKMWEMAEKLSLGFDQVRVDFYDIDDVIYFGEMTFTNGSGFEKFNPASKDVEVGEIWDLDMETILEKREKLVKGGAIVGPGQPSRRSMLTKNRL